MISLTSLRPRPSMTGSHPELHLVLQNLRSIHASLSDFRPTTVRPPILDASTESLGTSDENDPDDQWLQQDSIPGLKQLRDSIKVDVDVLKKFLEDAKSAQQPPLSTNAPYLISVWNEVLCAPPILVSVLRLFSPKGPVNRKQKQKVPVKVDVVADNGRRWIRVNTIKNNRLMSEFREMDSYLTDSDDDDGPSLAPAEFDNSVLRMGRDLLAAAQANPIDTLGGAQAPRVTLRLTRLDPSDGGDPRISQTVDKLRDMGIDVALGDRSAEELAVKRTLPPTSIPAVDQQQLAPSVNVNLDLSVLIALVSDLTHTSLPASIEEAQRRYGLSSSIQNVALTTQIMQEMLQEMGQGGMFQELHSRVSPHVKFWTTVEARERFVRIVGKIGGQGEKRRAQYLFSAGTDEDIAQFWAGSRFPVGYIPLLPINIYDESEGNSICTCTPAPFFRAMEKTCCGILTLGESPGTDGAVDEYSNNGFLRNPASQRAAVTRVNGRLTAHTVKSMLLGSRRGWTTLTANKNSIKALMREVKAARLAGKLTDEDEGVHDSTAVIWIVDPRSLAEGARERAATV
ncbi:unnamed protein product [Mycena citricolor]|uniref:DUF1308 domain-containing protein n=1 Tax=Mycena citricolor TaxID=2018698 RepID=A0AAD2Q5D9_9AGAR|nr:unnamed protein product [Mycena citricolor]